MSGISHVQMQCLPLILFSSNHSKSQNTQPSSFHTRKMLDECNKSAASLSKSAQSPSDAISIGNGTAFDNSSAASPIHPIRDLAQQSPEVTVTKREDVFISRVKVLVAFVLLVAVSGVATVAYLLVSEQELEGFENQVGCQWMNFNCSARLANTIFSDPLVVSVQWTFFRSCCCCQSEDQNTLSSSGFYVDNDHF